MNGNIDKATIQDIARKLNVNASTVSRALNGHRAISEITKKRVLAAAKKLNYHPNRIASSLRLGKTEIIGVIIPSTEISFFASVIHGIENIATQNNCSVLIYQSNEMPEAEMRGIRTFLHARVDGVLASISKETTSLGHFQEIIKRGVPLVLFDRVTDKLQVPSVVVDDYKGAFNATTHLINEGCRSIAHIAGQKHVTIFTKRLKGYKDALLASGLPVRNELIVYGNITVESGMECMRHLLALPQPPDAVFAVEDFTALGAMQELKRSGKKIPDEIALIGFANASFSNYITPGLSTVDQQAKQMGEEAAKLFFLLSSNKSFYRIKPEKIVLEPELIIRASSSKIKKNGYEKVLENNKSLRKKNNPFIKSKHVK